MGILRATGWTLGCALALACGGRVSRELHPSDTPAGSAGSGGSSGASGALGDAGTGAAGFSGTAGSAGVAGAAGAAPECSIPPMPSPCEGSSPGGYYFDPSTGRCTPYDSYCSLNANYFDTYEQCANACHPERFACSADNDCALSGVGCCGWACTGELDLRAFVAYNRKFATEQSNEVCPFPHYCGPGEPGPDDPLAFTCQYAIAICAVGRCRAADLRTLAVSACRRDADCSVRVSSRCCPNVCAPPLVAVSSESGLERIVCADGETCAGDCSPPSEFGAVCVDRVCTVAHAGL